MKKKPTRGSRDQTIVVRAPGTERPSQREAVKATPPVRRKTTTLKRLVSSRKVESTKQDVVRRMKALRSDIKAIRKQLLEANRIARALSSLEKEITSGMNELRNAAETSLTHFDSKLKTLSANISEFDRRITKVETEFYAKMDYLSGNFSETPQRKSESHSGTRKSPFGAVSEQGLSGPALPGSFESTKR
jgi:predicted  nucleic acid-binding Zn-ribbon protein